MAGQIKALFFDVFGTLVDWRNGVARESEKILSPLGCKLDWLAFAEAWRGEYQTGLEEVRSGKIPFSRLDVLHRRNLDRILPRFELQGVDIAKLDELNLVWHRLDGWPDVTPGLVKLKKQFMLAPVSNGNISMMVDIARHNGFPWDTVLGAEVAGDYKPKPRVYHAACEALGLSPAECMMVAAHSYDLQAAMEQGLRSAHVARPNEAGPGKGEKSPKVKVDYAVASLEELAAKLSAG